MAFVSGLQGYVNVSGVLMPFGKWRMPVKVIKPRMNNFKSGFQRVVSGLPGATIDIEGPWDVGNMGMAAGGAYVFLLGVTPSVYLQVTAVIDWEASNDVEDAPRVRVTGDSDGAFSLVIL